MKAELLAHFGDDLMVVNAARVSFAKWKDKLDEKDEKLIRYLVKHDHWTPLAHPQIQFRITAPMFVARQWFRSTVGVARNEESRRYVDHEPTFFAPGEWRKRPDGSIKQGSGEVHKHSEQFDAMAAAQEQQSLNLYKWMIEEGIAPEQARMVLPQSAQTTWIETGSLAYYGRICKQRLDAHAQKEIQDLAREISDRIAPLFPVSWQALINA
jgi:thymidylate synthase (FAD)